jgi:transcriptional regulator with XRE-family HTH domain
MTTLRKLRDEAGVTQYTVARKSGVPRVRLSLAECGELRLTRAEEVAIREAIRQEIERRAAQLQRLVKSTEVAA